MSTMAWPLRWIERDTLAEIVRRRFRTIITAAPFTRACTEPTLTIARYAFLGVDTLRAQELEATIRATKTLQNAIGYFHQDVLGAVQGWNSTGISGGGFDLRSDHPVSLVGDKYVVAEVKMRYNTIKASDRGEMFRKLRDAANFNSARDRPYIAYLFEIVPDKQRSYDTQWKVAGHTLDQRVRVADGVTAYHIVTGEENALYQLFRVLPQMFAEVFEELTGGLAPLPVLDAAHVDAFVAATMPATSAHAATGSCSS